MNNQQDFQDCLRDKLRFTNRQIDVLMGDGYETADDLAFWSYSDISGWVTHKEKIKSGNATILFGDMRKKNLTGLAWWITERVRTGLPVELAEFDDEARRQSIIEARVEHDDTKVETQATKPEKFKYEEWPEWEKSVYTYLLSSRNSMGIPMAYVIRKQSMYAELDERSKRLIENANIEGALFRSDSLKVLSLLKSLTVGTDAENWMKGKTCGRTAMQALQAHYDGDAEAEKRKEAARADLKVAFYRHEASFPFEKYINRLKKCFDTLEKYGVPYYEEDKVKLLLDRIQSSHGEVKTQASICRANHSQDFLRASTYMSREISRIFPSSNVASLSFTKGRPKTRNVSSAHSHKGKKKRLIVESNNGVNISDPTRYFSKEEWDKLDPDTRKKILDNPDRKRRRTDKQKGRARNTSSVVVSDKSHDSLESGSKESEDRMVSAIIRGVMESSRTDADHSTPGPRHGSRHVSSQQSVGSVGLRSRASTVTFDRE